MKETTPSNKSRAKIVEEKRRATPLNPIVKRAAGPAKVKPKKTSSLTFLTLKIMTKKKNKRRRKKLERENRMYKKKHTKSKKKNKKNILIKTKMIKLKIEKINKKSKEKKREIRKKKATNIKNINRFLYSIMELRASKLIFSKTDNGEENRDIIEETKDSNKEIKIIIGRAGERDKGEGGEEIEGDIGGIEECYNKKMYPDLTSWGASGKWKVGHSI